MADRSKQNEDAKGTHRPLVSAGPCHVCGTKAFTGLFEGDDGTFYAPYFSIDAIYNIGDTTGVTITNPSTPATEGWRARLKAGVNITTETGVRIGFGGTYDGIGRDNFDVWGLIFDLTIPLSKPKAR